MKVMIVGDIHGEFKIFNYWLKTIIKTQKIDIIISCGDFGYWPGSKYNFNDIKLPEGIKLYWCCGNHERHDLLSKFNDITEISNNIFYVPRGKYITVNEKNIMFFGGANSIDRGWRTAGINWFPEENISEKDLYNLPDIKIDIMITHTCPEEFVSNFIGHYKEMFEDINQKKLSYILKKYKPESWFFGHWHIFKTFMFKNTKCTVLSNIESGFKFYTIIDV